MDDDDKTYSGLLTDDLRDGKPVRYGIDGRGKPLPYGGIIYEYTEHI